MEYTLTKPTVPGNYWFKTLSDDGRNFGEYIGVLGICRDCHEPVMSWLCGPDEMQTLHASEWVDGTLYFGPLESPDKLAPSESNTCISTQYIIHGKHAAHLAARTEPAQFPRQMGNMLGFACARLTDEQWQRAMFYGTRPCGAPDCGCEFVLGPLMEGLDAVRERHQKLLPLFEVPPVPADSGVSIRLDDQGS